MWSAWNSTHPPSALSSALRIGQSLTQVPYNQTLCYLHATDRHSTPERIIIIQRRPAYYTEWLAVRIRQLHAVILLIPFTLRDGSAANNNTTATASTVSCDHSRDAALRQITVFCSCLAQSQGTTRPSTAQRPHGKFKDGFHSRCIPRLSIWGLNDLEVTLIFHRVT